MWNEKNEKTWCFNIEHALRLDNSHMAMACCMMTGINDQSDRGKKLIELFNKPKLSKVREDLQNGIRNEHCKLCWQEEDSGRDSKRIRDNQKYLEDLKNGVDHQGITSLELNLGNTCNIKCRTCNPYASSLWAKEYYDLYADKERFKSHSEYSKTISVYHEYYDDDQPFWDDLENNLPNLKNMVFYGGEPFLSKKMWKILGIAVEKGYSKEISLDYNTNGTIWPKEVDYWKHFKEVRISFSIDGTHKQFNYMRYPADWDIVTQNMNKALDLKKNFNNIYCSWCVTLSPLNIYYVNEIIEEMDKNFNEINLYLNLIHMPNRYNIKILPNHIKEIVIKKISLLINHTKAKHYIKGIIEFINSDSNDEDWFDFLKATKIHDKYRNQNYLETFPEFAKIIGYDNE